MPDIGTTLREARVRQRIDISDVESTTKIRAKYLRALENEEWDLLPGPTFVKSFLKTYADALGLDGKLLIEEYKLHHERLSEVELQPIGRTGGPREGRRRGPRRSIPRGWWIAVLAVALVVAVALIGALGGDEPSDPGPNRVGTTTTPSQDTDPGSGTSTGSESEEPAPELVTLAIRTTGQVSVCLQAAGPRTLVNGILLADTRRGPYRSQRFRVTLSNSQARLVIDGKARQVGEATEDGIGYEVTADGLRRLAQAAWPTCPSA